MFRQVRHVVFEVTRACNLSCAYCYAGASPSAGSAMPIEVFRRAIDVLLVPSQADSLTVQFHGGEPLLLPVEWFSAAIEYAGATLSRPGRRIRFSLQTNATLATEERVHALVRLGIRFSVSLDGPPAVSDAVRGLAARTLAGRRAIQEIQEGGVGVLTVLDPVVCARIDEVLDFFDEEGIRDLETTPVYSCGRGALAKHATTAPVLFAARRRILDRMLATRGRGLVDRAVAETLRTFVFGRHRDSPGDRSCSSFYCGAGTSVVAVDPEGGVHPCHRSTGRPRWRLFDVFENEGREGPWRDGLDRFHGKGIFWAACGSCSARAVCPFSCSAFYVDGSGDEERDCAYTRTFHEHLLARGAEIRELAAALASRLGGATDRDRLLDSLESLSSWARGPGRRVLGWTPQGHVVEFGDRCALVDGSPPGWREIGRGDARALLAAGTRTLP